MNGTEAHVSAFVMRRLVPLFALLCVATSGCVVVSREPPAPPRPEPWRIARPLDEADRIFVTPGTDLGRRVALVGAIDLLLPSQDEDAAFDALRRAASVMGADAVVSTRFERPAGMNGARIFGVAVRALRDDEACKPLVNLDVDATDEGEAKAVARLLAIGRSFGDAVAITDFGWIVVGKRLHARATAVSVADHPTG